jgi:hypothetical protein
MKRRRREIIPARGGGGKRVGMAALSTLGGLNGG